MPQSPSIDIVVLNFNTREILAKCLPKVIRCSQHENVRVVLADNASTDGSMDYAKSTFGEQIDYIDIPSNLGFAGGYNYALKTRTADFFLLLNSDAEPADSNWLKPLIECSALENFGAAQPSILDYYHREKFEYAGAAGGYIDYLGFPFCRGRIFGNVEPDNGQYHQTKEIFWASGASLFVKREAWTRAGGLDEQFFAHMEEIDLCWRIKNIGYRIYHCPKSKVYHMGGATLSNQSPKKTFLNFRNGLLMMYKNLPVEVRDKRILKRKMMDGLAGIFFILQGKIEHTFQIIKAHRAFDKLKVNYSENSNNKHMSEHTGVLTNSLVWGYFFKRLKTWSQWKEKGYFDRG